MNYVRIPPIYIEIKLPETPIFVISQKPKEWWRGGNPKKKNK